MKQKKKGIKRIIITGCITCLCVLLLSPFYTDMLNGFIDSRINGSAIIHLQNTKDTEINISSTENKDGAPSLKKNSLDNETILEAKINSEWKDFEINIKALNNSDIILELTSNLEPIKDKTYPIITDFQNLQINNEFIFKEITHVWKENPYHYTINLSKGDLISIKMQIRKHHFSLPVLIKTYQFEWGIFISVFILSLLLAYKIVQYMAQFKIIENNSRIDIVFVVVFIGLLFLPMSHMDHGDKSEKENRTLMMYQPLFKGHKLNLEYGKQFEEWFNDRFWGRKTLINLYSKFSLRLNKYGKNRKASIFKDDWLLNKSEENSFITSEQLEKINEGVESYLVFCKKHHIKCYIEIVPRKLEFIKDKTFRIVPENEEDKAKIIVRHVKEKQNYDIVYPIKELHEANKKDLVFYKTDHHWTEWGAYVGYQALMKQISKNYPNLKTIKEDDYDTFYRNDTKGDYDRYFNVGSTCMLLHLRGKDCPLKVPYKYYRHKKEKDLVLKRDDSMFYKNFYYKNAPNHQKVFIIGNSFTENFGIFSPYAFPFVYNRRCNNKEGDDLKLSRWKNEIIKNSIDIVVILISSEYSDHLADLKE